MFTRRKPGKNNQKEQLSLYYLLAGNIRFYPKSDLLEMEGRQKKLEPQVSQLLKLMLDNRDGPCSKEYILQSIWQDRVVTDDSVRVLIRKLRDELGDEVKSPKFIKTISREGYQLICSVEEQNTEKPLTDRISLRLFIPFLVFVLFLLIYWFAYLREPSDNVSSGFSIVELTQLPGSELAPDYHLDSDRLVFSYRKNQEDLLSLYVKDQKTETIQKLSDDNYNYINAFWNTEGDKLFYTRFLGEDSQHFSADFSDSGLSNQQALPQQLNHWYLKSVGADDSLVFASVKTPRSIAVWNPVTQELRQLTSPVEGEGDIYAIASSDGTQLAVIRALDQQKRQLSVIEIQTGTLLFSEELSFQAYRILWTDADSNLLISSFSGELVKLNIAAKSWSSFDLQQENINHLFFDCGTLCFFARQHNGNYLDIAEQLNPFAEPSNQALMTISSSGIEDFPVYGSKGTVYFAQKQSDGVWLTKKEPSLKAQKLFLLPASGDLQALTINKAKTQLAGKIGKRMFYFDINALHFQWISDESDDDFFPHFEPDGKSIRYFSKQDGILQSYRFDIATEKLTAIAGNRQFLWPVENKQLVLDAENTLWLKTVDENQQQKLLILPSSSPNRFRLFDEAVYFTDRTGNHAYLYRFSLKSFELEKRELAKNRLKLHFDISDDGNKLLGVNSVLAQSNLVKVQLNQK